MPDMYEFAVNEEEFVALINELLGKTTPQGRQEGRTGQRPRCLVRHHRY